MSNPASRREFTFQAFVLGAVLAVVMCAANAYLGLYAGMTVSASIPAAVISMAILRGVLRRGSILENNIVQTMASSGESLAAGIIFTMPALVLTGAWTQFKFWPTTLVCILGGLLGALFMIPLRRVLIVEDQTLTYPEGVACAEVLRAGEEGVAGFRTILHGLTLGALIKLGSSSLGLLKSSLEFAGRISDRVFYAGMDASPALIAVGYIINIHSAILIFLGGFLAWNIGIPLLGVPPDLSGASAAEIAGRLWSTKIRYIGVGVMITGGFWSIISIRRSIIRSMQSLIFHRSRSNDGQLPAHTQDLPLSVIAPLLAILIPSLFFLYNHITGRIGIAFLFTFIMVILGFIFTAVSSYIVGLVGCSNNPVSGMTICALLATAGLFVLLGVTGKFAVMATLVVSGVVCCAACSAGDMSQDLKTGYLIGASPRAQQLAQIVSVIIPAFVLAPTLSLLHSAYGIGTKLQAPQATLFASITQSIFEDGTLQKSMIIIGLLLGALIVAADEMLKRTGSRFRLHIMPLAVGIYLPMSLSVSIFLGGVLRFFSDRQTGEVVKDSHETDRSKGVLLSSGLIAGEAIMGIILAVPVYFGVSLAIPLPDTLLMKLMQQFLTAGAMAAVVVVLLSQTRPSKK